MVKVEWTKIALNDLRGVYEYICRDSKKYAALQIKRIRERTNILKESPQFGKKTEEVNEESVREIIEGNYRIVYEIISPTLIHILAIHHSARDFNKRTLW